jgi:hypothetical protein
MNEKPKELFEELEELSKPLLDFLDKYFNIKCSVIINCDNIKIVSDELSIPVTQSAD